MGEDTSAGRERQTIIFVERIRSQRSAMFSRAERCPRSCSFLMASGLFSSQKTFPLTKLLNLRTQSSYLFRRNVFQLAHLLVSSPKYKCFYFVNYFLTELWFVYFRFLKIL
jgi:hypothetical protein